MPTERWKAGKHPYENCKYIQVRPKGIQMDIPKITPVGLSAKAVYRNDDECKITVPNQIPSQNFLTGIEPIKPFKLPNYIYGTDIEVEPLDDDMLRSRITLNIDLSVP